MTNSAQNTQLRLTLIGGPTVLIEYHGLRLLTDPTFDPAGEQYSLGAITLKKTGGPAVRPESIGTVDAVLLSHDQHQDNLDSSGRALLADAGQVLTTPEAAERLGGAAIGLSPWQAIDVEASGGQAVRVTATPARHGPEGIEPIAGPVTGFILTLGDDTTDAVYVSGDTVWYEGVAEVARRYSVRVVILFVGAARADAVSPAHLTMTAEEAVTTARAFPDAVIVPAHFEGWAHFSEGRAEVEKAFAEAGLTNRLRWLTAGEPTAIEQR